MISASLVQFDVVPLASEHNIERMCKFIEAEAASGATLIVFPELCNTGYVEPLIPGGPMVSAVPHYGNALYQACADIDGPQIQKLKDASTAHNVVLVVGLGVKDQRLAGVMRNASLLITPTGIEGVYVKVHQWHNEKLYFTRGDSIATYPVLGTRLGMQICYDIRFPEITRIMACEGAGIITSVWASFGAESQPVTDDGLYIHRAYTRAVENGVYFLSCNRAGLHGDQRFMGRSCVIAPDGRVVGHLDHDREDVLRVELDLDDIARYRAATGIWVDRVPELYAKYAPSVEKN